MDPNAAIFAEDSYHQRDYNTVMEAIDKRVFLKWKYRDTFWEWENIWNILVSIMKILAHMEDNT